MGGKLPEGRESQGAMTHQNDTARRQLPHQPCCTPGWGAGAEEASFRDSASWRSQELTAAQQEAAWILKI